MTRGAGGGPKRKTHCIRGHAFTEENTYRKGRHVKCRQCHRERNNAAAKAKVRANGYVDFIGPMELKHRKYNRLLKEKRAMEPKPVIVKAEPKERVIVPRKKRTHCHAGHEYTEDNVYLHYNKKTGAMDRSCQICKNISQARYRERYYKRDDIEKHSWATRNKTDRESSLWPIAQVNQLVELYNTVPQLSYSKISARMGLSTNTVTGKIARMLSVGQLARRELNDKQKAFVEKMNAGQAKIVAQEAKSEPVFVPRYGIISLPFWADMGITNEVDLYKALRR